MQRDADRVGVMPVRREGMARKARLDPLEARARRARPDPVARPARSFKTTAPRVV
jgi:hypothetical protein